MPEWIAVIGKVEYRWQYDQEKQRLVRKIAIHPIGVPDDSSAKEVLPQASALPPELHAEVAQESREPAKRKNLGHKAAP